MYKNRISPAVIRRLPKYYYYLQELEKNNVEKISSKQLSEITGYTASQIRQDLNHFGGFGQQGYGYRVVDLKNSVREIIGLEKEYNVIIVGYGHIGRAIYNYNGFETKKFNVLAVFDKEAHTEEDLQIKSIEELPDFLDNHDIDIVVLTVPKEAANDIVDVIKDKNIKGIWNFAPTALSTELSIPVENILLSESLYALIYYMGNPEQYR